MENEPEYEIIHEVDNTQSSLHLELPKLDFWFTDLDKYNLVYLVIHVLFSHYYLPIFPAYCIALMLGLSLLLGMLFANIQGQSLSIRQWGFFWVFSQTMLVCMIVIYFISTGAI